MGRQRLYLAPWCSQTAGCVHGSGRLQLLPPELAGGREKGASVLIPRAGWGQRERSLRSDPPELAGGREKGAPVQLWEALDFFALKGDF